MSTSNVRGVRLMVRVGRMHYEQGLRQMEIAEKLEISTAKVSRLLKRAEAEGIVRTMVMTPQGMHPELEEFLEEEYGLEEVIVADARGSAREVLPALSAVGAEYVHRSLQTPGTAGVSAWSETLDGVALNLRVDAGARAGTVVQLIGGSGPASAQLASMQMLERFAKALSAEPVMVPFAGVVSTAEARRVILEDSSLADVVEQWDSVDIAFLGIGGLQASPTLRRSGNISTSVQEELRKLGSVGDICLRHFDAEGSFIESEYDSRIVGVTPGQLLKIPRRVGIAGGDEKVSAIRAALHGKHLTTLITDEGTAMALREGRNHG